MYNARPNLGESLVEKRPDLIPYWDKEKNGTLSPMDYKPYSSKVVAWKCNNGHTYDRMISERVRTKGCPYCSNNETSYPEQFIYRYIRTYYPDAINGYKTRNNIEYDIYIPSMRLVIDYNSLIWHQHKKDYDSIKLEIALENKIDYIRIIEDTGVNGGVRVDSINTIYINPNQINDISLEYIVKTILSRFNHHIIDIDIEKIKSEALKYSKSQVKPTKSLSYLRPDLVFEWDTEQNTLTPDKYSIDSQKKVQWKCNKGHTYQAHISDKVRGYSCPYCSGQKVNIGTNDLASQCPELLKDWDYSKNESLRPDQISIGSNKVIWWRCHECGYEWQRRVYNRVRGGRCPRCIHPNLRQPVLGADGKQYYI